MRRSRISFEFQVSGFAFNTRPKCKQRRAKSRVKALCAMPFALTRAAPRDLQGVKLFRIVCEYSFLCFLTDTFHALKFSKRAHCARGIGVAVVGTDDEPVLSHIADDIRDIVIDLAGDV